MADLSDKILQLDRSQEEAQAKAKAQKLGMPYINVAVYHLDADILKLIPKQQVQSLQCIPLALKDSKMVLGVVDPESEGVLQGLTALEQMTGYQIIPAVISASGYKYGYKTYELSVRENEGERPVAITQKAATELQELEETLKKGQEESDVNVTDLFSAILEEGIRKLASDIHFEPMEDKFEIRFRIDGVLHVEMQRPLHEYKGLASRIKYLAKMPLSSSLHPEDGRFTITVANTPLDLRVASLPTVYGDMITVRILHKDQVLLKLPQLGMRPDLEKLVSTAMAKPHGMILVSGPTGSGKTTTLYSILQEMNNQERKIITIEDPVEYKLQGLEQSQVDVERGYDFAMALRGALRQDPDVLMIGEIRDKESANIGIRAALTGHIVLATIHSNTAVAAYNRLLEMGVEPFLFSGSINIIMAQRLLRLLCENCKKSRPLTPDETKLFQTQIGQVPQTVYEEVGCEQCGTIGYRGRTAIFEVVVPTVALEQLAITRSPLSDFNNQAHKDGLITLYQDGLFKAAQGVTSLAEVARVTSD